VNETLRNKVKHAMAHPDEPLLLTSVEAAELDAYLALVEYFERLENGGKQNA
jgi:hypothetical protein